MPLWRTKQSRCGGWCQSEVWKRWFCLWTGVHGACISGLNCYMLIVFVNMSAVTFVHISPAGFFSSAVHSDFSPTEKFWLASVSRVERMTFGRRGHKLNWTETDLIGFPSRNERVVPAHIFEPNCKYLENEQAGWWRSRTSVEDHCSSSITDI